MCCNFGDTGHFPLLAYLTILTFIFFDIFKGFGETSRYLHAPVERAAGVVVGTPEKNSPDFRICETEGDLIIR